MSTISVRLPDSIYGAIKEIAEREGFSVDQFIASAAAEKLAAFLSTDDLEERARREALQAVLARVPHVQPDPGDEI